MAQRQMSFPPLPSCVETTLPSERDSRTTMGLNAEQLTGEILLKGRRKGVPAQQQHLQRSSRNGQSRVCLTLFQSQQSQSLLLLKVKEVKGANSSFWAVLKGKGRHVKNCESLCRQTVIRIGQCPAGSDQQLHWHKLGQDFYREEAGAKKGNDLIGSQLKYCLVQESPGGCL